MGMGKHELMDPKHHLFTYKRHKTIDDCIQKQRLELPIWQWKKRYQQNSFRLSNKIDYDCIIGVIRIVNCDDQFWTILPKILRSESPKTPFTAQKSWRRRVRKPMCATLSDPATLCDPSHFSAFSGSLGVFEKRSLSKKLLISPSSYAQESKGLHGHNFVDTAVDTIQ